MNRLNLIISILIVTFSLLLINFSFAQDSTQTKHPKKIKDVSKNIKPVNVNNQKSLSQQTKDPVSDEFSPFEDANGDGINDNRGKGKKGKDRKSGNKIKPMDGSGGAAQTGVCDTTATKGSSNSGRKAPEK